jgi:hypothetical protein
MTRVWSLIPVFLLACGCGSATGRLAPPNLPASAAATQALEQYDVNKDGVLDAKELEQCPALKSNLEGFDKDKDGKLSHDEIAARLRSYAQSGVAVTTASFQVLVDEKPVSGAVVKLIPEKFLGANFKPAEGVTDEFGSVSPETEGLGAPGIQCALYRIEVTWKGPNGKEQLPARYNSATTLGQEIAHDTRQGNFVLRLKKK